MARRGIGGIGRRGLLGAAQVPQTRRRGASMGLKSLQRDMHLVLGHIVIACNYLRLFQLLITILQLISLLATRRARQLPVPHA